jgi:hypothetical protein
VLVLRLGLGIAAALWSTLVYGEADRFTTQSIPLPTWLERLCSPDAVPGPAPQPAVELEPAPAS